MRIKSVKVKQLAVCLTSSSGEGGSGMGMSRGAWSNVRSVMLKASSWKHTHTHTREESDDQRLKVIEVVC